MKVTNNEFRGFTDVIRLDATALKAIGTGGTKVIATIPAGGACEQVCVINTVDIAGSSSLLIDVGTTVADPDEFIKDLDVDAMTPNLPTFNTGISFVQTAGNTTVEAGALPAGATATAVPVYVKVTDAAIASITAGEILIALRILDPLALN
jgi:hypothetical protein